MKNLPLIYLLLIFVAVGCTPISDHPTSHFGPEFISIEFDRISVYPIEDLTSNKPGRQTPFQEPKRFMFSFTGEIEAGLNRKGYQVYFVDHPGKLQSDFFPTPSRLDLHLVINRFGFQFVGNIQTTCSGRLTDTVESATIWQRTISTLLRQGQQLPSPSLERDAAADCIRILLRKIPRRWTPMM